jgi:hypothetical protein
LQAKETPEQKAARKAAKAKETPEQKAARKAEKEKHKGADKKKDEKK